MKKTGTKFQNEIKILQTRFLLVGVSFCLLIFFMNLSCGKLCFSFSTGFFIGYISFFITSRMFTAMTSPPKSAGMVLLPMLNLKFLFLLAVIIFLAKSGQDILELSLGLLVSQIALLLAVISMLWRIAKNAEDNKEKEDLCTH